MITLKDLQKLAKEIQVKETTTIEGLYTKPLKRHVDARGELTELWSESWSNSEPVKSEVRHVYSNVTHQGVVKAWHLQEKTYSQYTCIAGKLQVVLVDVRADSPTRGHANQFLLGTHNPMFILIPPGILKGWKSVDGNSVIVNLLTTADIADNFKFPWDVLATDIWLPKMG